MDGRQALVVVALLLHTLCFPGRGAEDSAHLEIFPPSFLSAVTQDIELTCRPPYVASLGEVFMLAVVKQRESHLPGDPVASYVTAQSPSLEATGLRLGASVSGSYNSSRPRESFLTVTLPQPTEAASGDYSCVVHALDTWGHLHTYHAEANLVSLARNESVPAFYQTLLKELRSDLDTLTSDLNTVQGSQAAINKTDSDLETKLSAIEAKQAKIVGFVSDINAHLNVIDQANSSLHSQLDNLRGLTPVSPVNFYAYLSSGYITPGINDNVVFNVLEQHTDSSYSTSTGKFTAPVDGTYYFRTSLTGDANQHTYASLLVNNAQVLASLYAYDDYNYPQATASAVVELIKEDVVSVVKRAGAKVYGAYSQMNHMSYFMGVLLW